MGPLLEAHLRPIGRLDLGTKRAIPLAAPTRPVVGDGPERRLGAMIGAGFALDVEHSTRYQASAEATACNIFRHDWLRMQGVYGPRIRRRSYIREQIRKESEQLFDKMKK